MKKWFNLLLYSSFIFLAFYLYKYDFLSIPEVVDLNFILLAILLLIFGNIMQCLCWRDALSDQKINITPLQSISSHGLSAFMKYIPGKVMTIVGRAAYVSNVSGCKLKESSLGSFKAQIIELFFGTTIGLAVFIYIDLDYRLGIISIIMLVSLIGVLVFMKHFLKLVIFIAKKFGKKLDFEPFSVVFSIRKLILFSGHWLFWGLGFFFLAKSISLEVPFFLMLVFPLATVLGIAAIFAPGGIGVREGTITLLLTLSGVEIEIATSIAVLSRLWFLIGDLLIFSIASFTSRLI